tara:strand:+ start:67 stop:906 length:840 start_codon:yes stop_codon:yes gene_type:complete
MGFFKEINTLDDIPQFEVDKVAVSDANGNRIPDAYSLQRSDSGQHLGFVKDSYRPIQVDEMLNIINDASNIIGDIEHEGYTESANGKKMVVRSRLLHDINLDGDVIQPLFYTVIDNSGMGSNKSIASTVRIACDNAFHLLKQDAENATGRFQGVRHHDTFDEKIETMVNQIKANVRSTVSFADTARRLRGESFSVDSMAKLTQQLIPVEEEESTKRVLKRERIVELFRSGMGNIGKSKWDALNAVTEYETHTGKQSSEKFIRSFNGNTLSNQAHKMLVA